MAFDVLTLSPPPAHASAVHTFVVPVPSLGAHARCFGVLVRPLAPDARPSHRKRTGDRTPDLVVLLENIAGGPSLDGPASAWFPAFLNKLQEVLGASPGAVAGIGVGIAVPTADRRTNVTFAIAGPITALLIHDDGRSAPNASVIARPSAATATPEFRHTIEGAIGARDVIVLGPRNFSDVLPTTLLVHALTKLDRASGQTYLQHAIRTTEQPVGAIVITGAPTAPLHPQESMAAFLATATSTEQYLTPSLRPLLASWWDHARTTMRLFRPHPRASRTQRRTGYLAAVIAVIHLVFRTVGLTLRSAVSIAADSVRVVARALRGLRESGGWSIGARERSNRIPNPKIPIPQSITIIARARQAFAAISAHYTRLPSSSRRLLVLTMASAGLFLSSTVILWQRQDIDIRSSLYNTTIAEIDGYRSVAEAKLLFHDTSAARDALHTALERLATLPRTTKPRRERATTLEQEINATLDRARLLVRLPQPLVVTDPDHGLPFRNVSDAAIMGDQLIIVSRDGTTIARIAPRTGAADTRTLSNVPTLRNPRILPMDDRSVLLIDSELHAAIVDIRTNAVTTIGITAPPAAILDAAVTRGRLSLLLPDGSLTRHERTASGFASGVSVSTRGMTFASRVTAVGAHLLLTAPGAVTIASDQRPPTEDMLRDVDPPLTDAAVATITRAGDTIYLGDPREGRIIVLKRTGGLVGQVQSDAIRGLRRIILDQAESALYVLHHDDTISVIVPPKQER